MARLLIGLGGAIALLVPSVQPWDQADVVPVVGGLLLLACVVLPDSVAALLFLLVVVVGWVVRAPAVVDWSTVLTGAGLLLVHLASAYAGQLPSYVRAGRGTLRRWLLPASIALVLGPVVALGAALVRGAEVPGSLVVTVAALGCTGAVVWLTARPPAS